MATKTATKTRESPPIDIVGVQEDANLLHVSWNQGFLEKTKKEWGLEHKQAVLYVNVAQDRFRLVVCFYGWALLVLPPVDKHDRLSLYLKISRFLKRFAGGFDKAISILDSEIENANVRIERRSKLASTAARRVS